MVTLGQEDEVETKIREFARVFLHESLEVIVGDAKIAVYTNCLEYLLYNL